MAKIRKTTRARVRAVNGTDIANVTKAIHNAAARFLPKAAMAAQTIEFAGGGQMMSGKLSPPVQPSYYVAVIIPVYK
jgi:hypothetical protein